MFDYALKKLSTSVAAVASDPVDVAVSIATQPIKDAASVAEGLAEGEVRKEALARLGLDAASGAALGALVDILS